MPIETGNGKKKQVVLITHKKPAAFTPVPYASTILLCKYKQNHKRHLLVYKIGSGNYLFLQFLPQFCPFICNVLQNTI